MASAANATRLCAMACRRAPWSRQISRTRSATAPQSHLSSRRAFSASPMRRAEDKDEDADEEEDNAGFRIKPIQDFVSKPTPEQARLLDVVAKEAGYNSHEEMHSAELKLSLDDEKFMEKEMGKIRLPKQLQPRRSVFYDEDNPENNWGEGEAWDEDDITSMAHGRLDEMREMRHYARLAVWELPLLSKLAKPFEQPNDKQVLRWRYTTYMGEPHPAQKKVVVQFAPDDLKLSPVQTDKMKKLVGSRYNPETELVKMSCESYEHPAQNKRYLSNLVDDLITAAKDPTDTFEDIPLDLRHHPIKKKPKFPREWYMTMERQQELQEFRQRTAIADSQKAEQGLLVDGQKRIDEHLMQRGEQEQERVAQLVAAPQASRPASRPRR